MGGYDADAVPCRCPDCGSPVTERVGLPRFQTRTAKDPDTDALRIEVLGVVHERRCRCGCVFPEAESA